MLVSSLVGCTVQPAAETGVGGERSEPGTPAELIRVIDGDSLELRIDDEATEVRLIGINTPELYGPATDDGDRGAPTCNGEAAKAALSSLTEAVRLTVIGQEIDRFGRLLATVVVDDMSVNDELLSQGWALATGFDDQLGPGGRDRARSLMKEAAGNGRGMWGDRCGTPAASSMRIGDTQVDPPGRDGDNLNDEWVTVVNDGDDTVDLAGWVIRDDTTGHRFPLDGSLTAGAELVVRTGPAPPQGSPTGVLHLGERFPVWSNNGETVLLVDPDGVVAAWAFIE